MSVAASYEYDPFGKVISITGGFALNNPWRFSTKFLHFETSFYYYGYRVYDFAMGRWVNRDPIEEDGGLNVYGFLDNSVVDLVDFLGLIYHGRPPIVHESHDKLLKENRMWTYMRHSLIVKCHSGSPEEIRVFAFRQFQEFAKFDSSFAIVRLRPDGVALFNLLGTKGVGSDVINDGAVPVYLSSSEPGLNVEGRTAGNHQLVGIRRWNVVPVEGDDRSIMLETSAYEHPRGIANAVGMWLARRDQIEIWSGYLNRTADSILKKFGGVKSKVEVQGPRETGPSKNPYL